MNRIAFVLLALVDIGADSFLLINRQKAIELSKLLVILIQRLPRAILIKGF